MNKRIQIFPSRGAQSPTGWMVQSDFDGTISLLDVTDTLLNRFGQPGWQELEDAWERGDIGSRECMKGQVALLDMSEAELDSHLDTIEIDAHFAGFVAEAKAYGVKVQVVSDGIDYAILHVLKRHGMGDIEVIANHLVQTGERSWRLDSPWASNHCERASGNCKCERLAEQQAVHGRVLYIGDSTSDFCVSGKADFVLAKYKLIDYCEGKGIAHARFEHFGQATRLLEQVLLGMEQAA
ncbi:phosphatase [Comamonas testosteroni]|uniref:Phosphatase n=1 Tax=Comamonas testosteroni TaxID=285 RepID=A0A373FQ73_COMTE|nr:MtnX-like HAD-IB family phosphatase [Comamonas testosteroni]RGE46321.1 phosphatase [Comamonas testosteroni]